MDFEAPVHERRDASIAGGTEALLSPSLANPSATPLFSVRAHFFVAFFGGVYATLIFRYLDHRKLGRTRGQLFGYITLCAIWTAIIVAVGYHAHRAPGLFASLSERRDLRLTSRVAALVVFGVQQYRLRKFYKASELSGHGPAKPWRPAIAASAIALILTLLASALGAAIAPPSPPS